MPQLKINHTIDGKPAPDPKVQARRLQLESKKLRADKYLWGIYLMLMIFSIIELYSASSSVLEKSANVYSPLITHMVFLIGGFVIVCLMQNIHYKFYRKSAWAFFYISLGLLAYSFFFGVNINNAMRAISILGITIQPPEIAKLATVVVLAKIMSKHQMRHGVTNKGIIQSLAVLSVFALLLFRNGLTNTILLGTVAAAMFVIGGTQGKKLWILLLLVFAVGGIVFYTKYMRDDDENSNIPTELIDAENREVDRGDVHKGRWSAFIAGVDTADRINDENRQVIFSKIAMAHGGVVGNGPGNSRESARLPLAYSDYIYSIIVEDTGFVGGILLLVLYLCLLARAGMIALKCSRAFPALLITGCATLIVTQALIHMCIVVGLFPVSGQPLPFISKGGTSIIVMSMAMGMMLSVSKYAVQHRKKKDENASLKEALAAGSDEAANPTQLTYDSI